MGSLEWGKLLSQNETCSNVKMGKMGGLGKGKNWYSYVRGHIGYIKSAAGVGDGAFLL